MRKILAQGDRDGACFLYSAANAGFALTGKKISRASWAKAVRSTPFDMDNFIAGRGTEKLEQASHLESLASEFLSYANQEINIKYHDNIGNLKKINRLIDESAVLILGVYDDEHWLTVVDVQDDNLYCACSSRVLEVNEQECIENISPNFRRYFNLKLQLGELRVGRGYGLHIKIEK